MINNRSPSSEVIVSNSGRRLFGGYNLLMLKCEEGDLEKAYEIA